MDVTTTTLKETISASGTIEPAQEASLSFLTSGTVTAVNVAVGDTAVSVGVGLVAGVHPARSAARLAPIDALRRE